MKVKQLNISEADYHAMPFNRFLLPNLVNAGYISGSLLVKTSDMATFMTQREFKATSSMEWGTLIDCLLTTPETFEARYRVLPATAPKKPSITQVNAKKPSPDTIVSVDFWNEVNKDPRAKITEEELSEALKAVDAYKRNTSACRTLMESEKQVVLVDEVPVSIFEQFEKEGISFLRKSMFDLLNKDVRYVADIKTTKDNSEKGIWNAIFQFKYQMKMALYQIMCEDAFDFSPSLILHFQRSSPPYDVNSVDLGPVLIKEGRRMILEAIQKLVKTNPTKESTYMNYGIKEIDLKS